MQNPRVKKIKSLFLLFVLLYQSTYPTVALALTGGPSQPEVQSFEPAGSSEMVDLSTGSFTYNIPLLDVGGYPINLAYHAGASMDQESSCVGLGWNINPGVINRNMRGLPDDFDGENMRKEQSIRPNRTYGATVGLDFEIFGSDRLKASLGLQAGIFYNNYRGLGQEFGINPSISAVVPVKDETGLGLGLNLNLSLNSQQGASAGIQPSVSFLTRIKEKERAYKGCGVSGGLQYNSKQGLVAASLGGAYFRSGASENSGHTRHNISTGRPATFSFARPAYLPGTNFPVANTTFTLRAAFDGTLFGTDVGISIGGYFSEQKLSVKTLTAKGYGSLYLHNQQPGTSLLDFNREKEGPVTQNIPNLALPVATQDVYSVSGQGIGGSYLLKRSDVGVFADKESTVQSGAGNLSVEIGGGNLTKYGADIVGIGVDSKNGRWVKDNNLAPNLAFKGSDPANPLYEAAYFKPAGEQSVESDPAFFNNVGGFQVVEPQIQKDANDKFKVQVNSALRAPNTGQVLPVSSHLARSVREKRNRNISCLTAQDASRVGLQRSIPAYPLNNFTGAPAALPRIDASRKTKHISEMTTLREDGARYVYGIPAYNTLQQDYTFSIRGGAARAPNCKTGLVNYNGPSDAEPERTRNNNCQPAQNDRFFSMEETPAYAYAYLLTAVLSPDYSDVDGREGPTEGDYGTYARFNYSRVQNQFKWRLPFPDRNNGTGKQAQFTPGLLSNPHDNRANIVYGEKEIWQLHSVESKLFVAHFYYSNRLDGLGVTGVDGTANTGVQQVKLDSIVLFSKADLFANPAAAVPVKKVSFVYDYSLSKNLPNHSNYVYGGNVANSGKLTLKKVYFTYGRSEKGRFSPYQFNYDGALSFPGSGADSLAYNYLSYNRWGYFQRSLKNSGSDCATTAAPGNDEAPYAVQDSLRQAQFAAAWNLSSIILPSGGRIDVTYESHDYAYVQNKPAMQMFQIAGVGADSLYTAGTSLYDPGPAKTQRYYLYFKAPAPFSGLSAPAAKAIIGRDYVKDIKDGYLYFKCLVNLKSTVPGGPHYEYVYGYAKIDNSQNKGWGVCNNNPSYGFIRLKNVCLGDKETGNCGTSVSPIVKAGFQFTRLHMPDLIHSTNFSESQNLGSVDLFVQFVESMADMFKSLQLLLQGTNAHMLSNNFSNQLELKKSWIRLYSPLGIKFAGGSRVKQLKISDEWQTLSTVSDKGVYGQRYDYRVVQDLGKNLGDGKTRRLISSGVASYEPMIGNDENPFRQPEFYDETLLLAPDNRFYQEHPFGESYFPAPQIIYSNVTVTSLKFDNSGNLVTPTCVSTGRTVSEYYTAKDFPTQVTRTRPQMIAAKSSPIMSFLKLNYQDYLTGAQGYCIERNDMHGKPRAQWHYDDKNQRVSGVEYVYKTRVRDIDPSPAVTNLVSIPDSLDNTAKVIQRDGKVVSRQIGIDFQLLSDARESVQDTRTRGVALNANIFLFGIFPIGVVAPWPVWENEKTRFRSMVTTKVINRYALLEKVIAYDASSRIETENVAYDAETGEVLLTRTYNEFGDPIYNLKLPAHFAYKGMRPACENIGVEVSGALVQAGGGSSNYLLMPASATQYFQPGDELMVSTQSINQTRVWVLNVLPATNQLEVINKRGTGIPFSPGATVNVKVIRSGFRNQQVAPIASISLKTNPIVKVGSEERLDVGSPLVSPYILDAVATDYSDYWRYDYVAGCTDTVGIVLTNSPSGPESASFVPGSVSNPYAFGRRGNWRPRRSWVFLTERTPISPTAGFDTRVRTEGVYSSFRPFWVSNYVSDLWTPSTAGWTWTAETTKYNPQGFSLESRDPLNRYSAELPGYGSTQAIAVAANARYREIASLNFEENGLSFLQQCLSLYRHFPNFSGGTMSNACSHSGACSLQILPGSEASTGDVITTFNPATVTEGAQDAPVQESLSSSFLANGTFGMQPDSTYLLSAWIRTDTVFAINKLTYKRTNNTHPRILVVFKNPLGSQISTVQLDPGGNVIEGWQRISQKVTVPSWASTINIRFANGTAQNAYFDDFRVQPFLSAMKTYVYDGSSTRLLAALDDENYATFYEYDQNGALERVKRETERGVMTIQETRTSLRKQ